MTLYRLKMMTKPFWVPSIACFYILLSASVNPLVLAALFFGWIGDILLMFSRKKWFITGAISFLIGHIFYSWVFIQSAGGLSAFKFAPIASGLLFLPYLIYIFIFRKIIGKNVNSIFYAAILYILVLLLMSYSALIRLWSELNIFTLLSWSGSILFIISDTLIAYRNLKRKLPGIEAAIIITYIAAQFMIISGLL